MEKEKVYSAIYKRIIDFSNSNIFVQCAIGEILLLYDNVLLLLWFPRWTCNHGKLMFCNGNCERGGRVNQETGPFDQAVT